MDKETGRFEQPFRQPLIQSGYRKLPTRRRIGPHDSCQRRRSSRRRRPGSFRICGAACRPRAASRAGPRYSRRRSTRRCTDQFAEAVALYPEHDQARALLGWYEYFVGDFRGATITFKTALRRQPTWEGLATVWAGVGCALGGIRWRLRRSSLRSIVILPFMGRSRTGTTAPAPGPTIRPL